MKIRKLLPYLLLVPLVVKTVLAAPTETRLVDRKGYVYVHLDGTPADDMIEAPDESSLDEGDQIVTGDNSSARLILDGDSIIELGPNSDFTIKQLNGPTWDFQLTTGRFLAKIKSLFEKQKTMSVRTPVAVAAVRGTELGMSYDEASGESDVGVFDEGKLSVESTSTGEKIDLTPGTETTIVRGLGRMRPRPLQRFEGFREQFTALRKRRDVAWHDWKGRTLEERQSFREKLRKERAIKRHEIPQLRRAPQSREWNRPQRQIPEPPGRQRRERRRP